MSYIILLRGDFIVDEYITIADICDKYKVTRKTVERWASMRSLPFVKLNDNNGAIRIKENEFQRWLDGLNSKNPIIKMRWCEYELKLKIHIDLFNKYKEKTLITEFDCFRSIFPQDFYIKLDNDTKYLINCSYYGHEGKGFFDDVAESINSRYTEKFICILININGFKYPSEPIRIHNATFIIVEPNEILNFEILNYIK
jgi:hypothetical protein